MTFTIDPRISFAIGIIATFCIFTSQADKQLALMFGAAAAPVIEAWCIYVGGLLTAVSAFLHGVPPSGNTPIDQAKKFLFGPKP